jgi:hypothetical protein
MRVSELQHVLRGIELNLKHSIKALSELTTKNVKRAKDYGDSVDFFVIFALFAVDSLIVIALLRSPALDGCGRQGRQDHLIA